MPFFRNRCFDVDLQTGCLAGVGQLMGPGDTEVFLARNRYALIAADG